MFFEDKRTSRRWVCAWALVAFLASSSIIYFAFVLKQAEVLSFVGDKIEFIRENKVQENLFSGLVILAILNILFSLFGMSFKWMRNRCCTAVYGALLLPLWLVTLAIGFLAIYISYTAADEFWKEC